MRALLFALALGLSACTPLHPVKAPTTLSEAQTAARQALDEANVLITACAKVIEHNVLAGSMTKAEAQGHLDNLVGYAARVDKAAALLTAGKAMEAMSQAELLTELLLALHREVAKGKP